jgi:hypothetical protein
MPLIQSLLSLLSVATATNGPPSTADDGVRLEKWWASDIAQVYVQSTAGTLAMLVGVRLWGYVPTVGEWFAFRSLNDAAAIAETSTDSIRYAERVSGIAPYSRIYAEVTQIGGTGTAVNIFLGRATV